jgi:hypothetical protein
LNLSSEAYHKRTGAQGLFCARPDIVKVLASLSSVSRYFEVRRREVNLSPTGKKKHRYETTKTYTIQVRSIHCILTSLSVRCILFHSLSTLIGISIEGRFLKNSS